MRSAVWVSSQSNPWSARLQEEDDVIDGDVGARAIPGAGLRRIAPASVRSAHCQQMGRHRRR